MTTLPTSKGFLSVRTNSHGKIVWAAFCRNQPLCAYTENLRDVLAVAKQNFGPVTLSLWNGDIGEYTSELVADPDA